MVKKKQAKPCVIIDTTCDEEFAREVRKYLDKGYIMSSSHSGVISDPSYEYCSFYQAIMVKETLTELRQKYEQAKQVEGSDNAQLIADQATEIANLNKQKQVAEETLTELRQKYEQAKSDLDNLGREKHKVDEQQVLTIRRLDNEIVELRNKDSDNAQVIADQTAKIIQLEAVIQLAGIRDVANGE